MSLAKLVALSIIAGVASAGSLRATAAGERSLKKVDFPGCGRGQGVAFFGSEECRNCSVGHYNREERSFSPCRKCASGAVAGKEGAHACRRCGSGHEAVEGEQKCRKCGEGEGSNRGGKCRKCRRGRFSNNGRCSKCPVGTFSNSTGAASCQSCPPGYVTAKSGRYTNSSCIKCEKGSYLDFRRGACTQCPAGSYPTPGKGDGGDDHRDDRRLSKRGSRKGNSKWAKAHKRGRERRNYNEGKECTCVDAAEVWISETRECKPRGNDTEVRTPVASPTNGNISDYIEGCGDFCGTAVKLIPCTQSTPVVPEYTFPAGGLCVGTGCPTETPTIISEAWVVGDDDVYVNRVGFSYYVSGDDITIDAVLDCVKGGVNVGPGGAGWALAPAADTSSDVTIGAEYEIFLSKWINFASGETVELPEHASCAVTATFTSASESNIKFLADGDADSFDFGLSKVVPCNDTEEEDEDDEGEDEDEDDEGEESDDEESDDEDEDDRRI